MATNAVAFVATSGGDGGRYIHRSANFGASQMEIAMTTVNESFTDACITIVRQLQRESRLDALASLFDGSDMRLDIDDWAQTIGEDAATALVFRVAVKKCKKDDELNYVDNDGKSFIDAIKINNEEAENYISILKKYGEMAKDHPLYEPSARLNQLRTMCRVTGLLDIRSRDALRGWDELDALCE
jgi:hypothetical protein